MSNKEDIGGWKLLGTMLCVRIAKALQRSGLVCLTITGTQLALLWNKHKGLIKNLLGELLVMNYRHWKRAMFKLDVHSSQFKLNVWITDARTAEHWFKHHLWKQTLGFIAICNFFTRPWAQACLEIKPGMERVSPRSQEVCGSLLWLWEGKHSAYAQ